MVTNVSRDERPFEIRPYGRKADSDGEAVSFGGWEISRLPFFTSASGDVGSRAQGRITFC